MVERAVAWHWPGGVKGCARRVSQMGAQSVLHPFRLSLSKPRAALRLRSV